MSHKKDDLPAMPFYVGDWLKAPDIQCQPYDIQGLWFTILCYMWESPERGYLINHKGVPYSEEELERLLRLPRDLLRQKISIILNFGIASLRKTDGAMFCRRMVRDQEIRKKRAEAGRIGAFITKEKYFAVTKDAASAATKQPAKCEDEIETENSIKSSSVCLKSLQEKKPLPVDNSNPERFALPSQEEIKEGSKLKIFIEINDIAERLLKEKIFEKAHVYKQAHLKKNGNERALLHTLTQCYKAKPENPWAYCTKIMKIENSNYNEHDYLKSN